MLQEMGRTATSQGGGLSDEDVLRVLRESPELLALLEPFMTRGTGRLGRARGQPAMANPNA